ncbi:MAG: helix-turn-helix domain-containing protein [Prevotella sp.]|jgi:transcriptional regulator GlxA family with amidase domain|nr:helix-turn-helix domain-containing protein [Prevotella sp.]MBP5507795.1 helix-turn-helix domain-containing protein [Prevotella sp.]
MTKEEIQRLQEENAALRKEIDQLKDELIRLVSRNLDLSERLEEDLEMRRRTEVALELLNGNIERQRNADLKDDAQLMALIELHVEQDRPHLKPDFDSAALAQLLGVSQERLARLFRHQTIHRTPDAYIDNLRVLAALRMLREKPQWSIAAVAEESGIGNVRTLQRRVQEVVGMTPVDYRRMLTRDQ